MGVARALAAGDWLLLGILLAGFGLLDSAYLAYQWYDAPNHGWCDLNDFFSCSRVRESSFSSLGGMPTAMIGVLGFALLLALLLLPLLGRSSVGRWSPAGMAVVVGAAGAGVGALLSAVEVWLIQAVCVLCFIGFILDLGVLGSAALAWRSMAAGGSMGSGGPTTPFYGPEP